MSIIYFAILLLKRFQLSNQRTEIILPQITISKYKIVEENYLWVTNKFSCMTCIMNTYNGMSINSQN